jgi:hypothetical protein
MRHEIEKFPLVIEEETNRNFVSNSNDLPSWQVSPKLEREERGIVV